MRSRHRQQGFSGGLVAILVVLVVVGFLATQLLNRLMQVGDRSNQVAARFRSLNESLAQYVAANARLPCPADPTLDDGGEVVAAGGTCTNPAGTAPWKTLGARRDDSIDPWGAKISYRVYTGSAGSLTQSGGASMVECDTVESFPATATTVVGSVGGLCRSYTAVTQRNTTPASFLAGKGLSVNDMGAVRADVAYVLISHGESGLGAYMASGIRRDMPAAGGDEAANTTATGPFVLKAFSTAGTDAAAIEHFDDFVSYRGIEELLVAAGVGARDWPEEAETSVTIDKPTIEAAVGHTVTPGQSVGQSTVAFSGITAIGSAGGAAADITYDESGGYGGAGIAGGGSDKVQSAAGEKLELDFTEAASQLGVTLNDFGYYGGRYFEVVRFDFYYQGSPVGTPEYGLACNPDGGLASFQITTLGTLFDRVDVTPISAYDNISGTLSSSPTAFYVTQARSCPSTAVTCLTLLADVTNLCSVFTPP